MGRGTTAKEAIRPVGIARPAVSNCAAWEQVHEQNYRTRRPPQLRLRTNVREEQTFRVPLAHWSGKVTQVRLKLRRRDSTSLCESRNYTFRRSGRFFSHVHVCLPCLPNSTSWPTCATSRWELSTPSLHERLHCRRDSLGRSSRRHMGIIDAWLFSLVCIGAEVTHSLSLSHAQFRPQ